MLSEFFFFGTLLCNISFLKRIHIGSDMMSRSFWNWGQNLSFLPLLCFFLFPCAQHIGSDFICSCDEIRWVPLPERKLPVATVRAPKDNCRLWGGLQQRRGEISECLGPTFGWWRYKWQKGEAKNLMHGCLIVVL